MGANKSYDVGPMSLVATNYQSTSYEAFLNIAPQDYNPVGYLEWAMSGNGQIWAEISFAAKSTTYNTWCNPLTFNAVSVVGSATHTFYASADDQVKPILPLARVRIRAMATSSGSVTFSDVLLKLLTESA